ncbi:MAG: hypothetical protein OXG47_05920 [bacterium]|nr:hypothetical protein [bacterium]
MAERIEPEHGHTTVSRHGLQGPAVAAAEPVGLAAGDAELRPIESVEPPADLIQRRPSVGNTGAHLVEPVDEQRGVLPLRAVRRIEHHEVPCGDAYRFIAERFTLTVELGRLAGARITEQHVGRYVSEVAERP